MTPRTIRRYMDEFDIPTRDPVGEDHPLHGTERPEAVRERISETLQDREVSEEWRTRIASGLEGNTLPEEVRDRISESLTGLSRPEKTLKKMSEARKGEKNPMWEGGHVGYYGPEWSAARRHVRARDEVCQECGHDGSERQLDVHHIIPVRLFEEADGVPLSDAHHEDNLVLLCKACHNRAEHGELEFDSGIAHPEDR